MPVGSLVFRSVCGTFTAVFIHFMYKRVLRYKLYHVNTIKIRTFRVRLIVVFLTATLLIRSGDVEQNPGPGNTQTNAMRKSTRQMASSSSSADDNISKQEGAAAIQEPSLSDLMRELSGMNIDLSQRLDTLNVQFDCLNNSVCGLRDEVTRLTTEMEEIRKVNEHLQEENNELTERLAETENKLDDLESRSKRNNLIFSGLKRKTDKETWEDCENLVHDVIRDQLEIDDHLPIERAHRLHRGIDSPIVAMFASYKDKQRVMKAKNKLSKTEAGKTIFIGEDFSKKVRETRKKLIPFLKDAKKDKSKKVSLVFDHLNINGKKLYYDHTNNALKENK